MNDFEAFEQELRRALAHLHDPSFHPPEILFRVTGCIPTEGAGPVQKRLAAAIGALKPTPDVAPDSRAQRNYDALHQRFILGLTQEETAERLHMSVRHLQRVQAEAIHILAQHFWAQVEHNQDERTQARPTQAANWQSQTDLELASLSMYDPSPMADVGDTIESALRIAGALTAARGFHLEVGHIQPDMAAAAHPAVLRQTLITTIGRLAEYASSGPITIYAILEDAQIKITITAVHAAKHFPEKQGLLGDIVTPPGATLEVHQKRERLFFQVKVPSIGERTVLVVEDNLDMVHFYRRCTTGTSYRIVHVLPDQPVFETIQAVSPDIIVLDVMLPDIDGWQLLTHLHENPATRPIPVVVCSVVKEENLALALGAAAFLSKPIQPRQFVQALDRVLLQGSTKAAKAP